MGFTNMCHRTVIKWLIVTWSMKCITVCCDSHVTLAIYNHTLASTGRTIFTGIHIGVWGMRMSICIWSSRAIVQWCTVYGLRHLERFGLKMRNRVHIWSPTIHSITHRATGFLRVVSIGPKAFNTSPRIIFTIVILLWLILRHIRFLFVKTTGKWWKITGWTGFSMICLWVIRIFRSPVIVSSFH